MTWGEFKQQVEAQNVSDEDEIRYIDIYGVENEVNVERETDETIAISRGRDG